MNDAQVPLSGILIFKLARCSRPLRARTGPRASAGSVSAPALLRVNTARRLLLVSLFPRRTSVGCTATLPQAGTEASFMPRPVLQMSTLLILRLAFVGDVNAAPFCATGSQPLAGPTDFIRHLLATYGPWNAEDARIISYFVSHDAAVRWDRIGTGEKMPSEPLLLEPGGASPTSNSWVL